MKLHLPLFLKSWLMLAIVAVAQTGIIFADSPQQGNISLEGSYDGTFVYYDDGEESATVTLTGDVSFTPADREFDRTFTSGGSLTFTGSGAPVLSFEGNTTFLASGGAIWGMDVNFDKLGGLSFVGNVCSKEEAESDAALYGGAIAAGERLIIKGTEGDIVFRNNRVEGFAVFGGAIAHTWEIVPPVPSLLSLELPENEEFYNKVSFSGNKGNISFIENTVTVVAELPEDDYNDTFATGGAIFSLGLVEFANNQGSITFDGNSVVAQHRGDGGAVTAMEFAMFGNKKSIGFLNNSVILTVADTDGEINARGGAVNVLQNMEIHHNEGTISFINNIIVGNDEEMVWGNISGGAVYTGGTFQMGWNKGDIIFRKNEISADSYEGNIYVSGGAVAAEGGFALTGNEGDILFEDNNVFGMNATGGAIYAGSNTGGGVPSLLSAAFPEETGIDGILISGNQKKISFYRNTVSGVYGYGGAVSTVGNFVMDGNRGDITFSFNGAYGGEHYYNGRYWESGRAMGGAIYSDGKVIISGNDGKVVFQGNIADGRSEAEAAHGGAIYSVGDVSITGNAGDVWFIGNNAVGGRNESLGGAIYAESNVTLVANRGDIYFTGNRMGTCGKSNAIYMGGQYYPEPNMVDTYSARADGNEILLLNLRAAEGRKIVFEDGIEFDSDGNFSIRMNEGAEKGSIIFSGTGAVVETGTRSYNKVETVLNGGTLLLERGAVYGMGEYAGVVRVTGNAVIRLDGVSTGLNTEDLTYSRQGTLDMAGGTVTAQNSISLHMAQVLVSNGGTMNAGYINMHGGLIYDLKSTTHLVVNPMISFTLDGNLTIRDNGLDIYRTTKFTQNQEILVMHNGGVLHFGTLDEILSETTNSYRVGDETTNQGYWKMEWRNDNKDLYAIWTVEKVLPDPIDPVDPVPPSFIEILPEHIGNMVPNTLWSTVSNINTLGTAAMEQVGLARFLMQKDSNYWVTGLGDFSQHKTVGATDGYEYNGGGYAVGADTKLTDKFIGGIAFGQLFGKSKSRGYSAEVDQKSYMGMLYGAWRDQLDRNNALNIQGSLTYGYTDNTLNTYYSTGERSNGSWDNNAYQATLRGTWDYALNDNWTLSPYIGVEYTDAEQGDFTESGDMSRRFGSSHLRNLSLPVGLGLTRLDTYKNGMKWVNGLTVGYVPDVYRENPESSVYRGIDEGIWAAKGVSAARNAVRVEFNSRLMLNENWSTFAGYELEGRSHAVYQRVNLGVSASF